MKKFATIALLATSLVTSAPAAITAGLEAGYLTESKDALWAGRVGWEFKTTTSLAHQVELELAQTEDKADDFGLFYSLKLKPITINYRAETTAANKLGYYFGAGAGQSKVSLSLRGSGVPIISDSGTALTIQAFAGVSYKATPTVSLHAGVKYLWIDDLELFGLGSTEVGDDIALTGGISIRF